MTRDGFMKIFWSFLFILLSIQIKGIDIAPDFIGYVLIVAGLGLLSSFHPSFKKARVFAAIMFFLSLADFMEQVIAWHGSVTCFRNPVYVYSMAGIASFVDLIMVWHICRGIIGLAIASGVSHLAKVAIIRRNLYFICEIIGLCICALIYVMPESRLGTPLCIALLLFAIVVMCLMMGLMKRCAEELSV